MSRFLLDDQIAAQSEAVRDALRRTEPPQLDPERPLVFTGIGTSLHACRVAAAWTAEITEGGCARMRWRRTSLRSGAVSGRRTRSWS